MHGYTCNNCFLVDPCWLQVCCTCIAASRAMAALGRRRNPAKAHDIIELLRAGLPEGLGAGIELSSNNDVLLEQKELLFRELLLRTPRPTRQLLQSAAFQSFQDADSGTVCSFADRVVACTQMLYQKLQSVSSGKKLQPAARRLIQIIKGNKSSQRSATAQPSKKGRFGQSHRRMLKRTQSNGS